MTMTYSEWKETATRVDDLAVAIPESYKGESAPGYVFDGGDFGTPSGFGDWVVITTDVKTGRTMYWAPVDSGEVYTDDFEAAAMGLWEGWVAQYHEEA